MVLVRKRHEFGVQEPCSKTVAACLLAAGPGRTTPLFSLWSVKHLPCLGQDNRSSGTQQVLREGERRFFPSAAWAGPGVSRLGFLRLHCGI